MVTVDKENSAERLCRVRNLTIEAGLEVLDRDGLGLRAESITYAKAFALLAEHGIEVGRGSVHGRIWASQAEFRAEVLTAAASHSAPYETGHRMHKAIVGMFRRLDDRNLTGRERVRAFGRLGGVGLLTAYLNSERFRRFQAIKAAAGAVDSDSAALLRSMVASKADGNQPERIRTFKFMFEALGLRGRRDLGLTHDEVIGVFMTMVQILVAGTHLDFYAGFTAMASKVETDLPSDEDAPWTSFGFGFLAFIELLFEPDPDAERRVVDYDLVVAEAAPAPPAKPRSLEELVACLRDKPRRSREELRELVVAAGVQVLLRDGLGLKAESLGYAAVFEHIKRTRGINIHRATVHPDIWSSQDDFRADVLAEAARFGTGESLDTMDQAMAAQSVSRNRDGSVNVRQLILDNSRATVEAQMRMTADSPSFRRWQLIKASMLSRSAQENADGLREAVNARYEEMLGTLEKTYRSVLPLVGLVVNPELEMSEDQAYHLFAVLVAALSTGSDFNRAAGSELAGRTVAFPRADAPDRTDDWTITALASLAVLDLLFVPAPVPAT